MPVSPDAVGYGDDGDSYNNDEQYRPDFDNPVHGEVDEETAECQQEAELEDFGDEFLWRFQASTPPPSML